MLSPNEPIKVKKVVEMGKLPYRETRGGLMYAMTTTRLDIVTTIEVVNKFDEPPKFIQSKT
jgi:hypothetical protein